MVGFRFSVALALTAGALLVMPAPGPAADADELASLEARLLRLEQSLVAPAGREIYRAACATCHGLDGRGKGPQALAFDQPPPDFTIGNFKLVSSLSDYPSPGDVERAIREGMSGTEMIAFRDILSEQSISAVTAYIKSFSDVYADGGGVPQEEELLDLPEARDGEATPDSIAAGKELWVEYECGDCHGEGGEGTPGEEDDWYHRVIMVDFREGYYKTGDRDVDLYRAIAAGVRGTTMDPYGEDLDEEETWALVDYIRSLSAEPQGFFGKAIKYLFEDNPSGFDYRPDQD